VRSGPGKTAKNKKKKEKKSTVVSSKKKSTVMSPIRRRMKTRNPSSGQNGQLVHWWLLIHSGRHAPFLPYSSHHVNVFSFHARHRSVSQQVWLKTHLSTTFKSRILFPQDNSAEP
jgi:hypothetical protein